MDSRRSLDSLSDFILVLIISSLPFKEAVKLSVVSKCWENLCHKMTNIAFKESEFVKYYVSDDEQTKKVARISFVRYMLKWVADFTGEEIKSFKLYLSKPVDFAKEIMLLLDFAVSNQVKNLDLDFSNPSWITNNEAAEARVFQLPRRFYNLTNLESLKLFACGFDPSKLAKTGSLKVLSFGWIQLRNIMSLISKCPLLESLSIQNCWDVGLEEITGFNNRLKELVFENYDFAVEYTTLDLPNIQIFKYSGRFHYFQFERVNRIMKEAYLDFCMETENHEGTTETLLCDLLYDLLSAKTLTICSFLIQLIQEEDPVQLRASMETRHLVMKTNLLPHEFIGIRLMINSCPDLEILTFQMVDPRTILTTDSGIDQETYWTFQINHRCLKKTLKVVELRNFTGGSYELYVLQFLIRCGLVLERVDLYLPTGVVESEKTSACVAAEFIWKMFEKGSKRLKIYVNNG